MRRYRHAPDACAAHARSVMYHPAAGVKADRHGVERVNRPWGFYQSSKPGHHVRWHRDINAAINMLKLFRALYHDGDVPWQFWRSTKKEQLERPVSLRYNYRWLKPALRLQRWTQRAPPA